jgi:predicted TPR repeat methyltransferase
MMAVHSDLGLLLTAARQAAKNGDAAKARELYSAVLQSNPNHPQALRHLARICEAAGQLEETAAYLRQFLSVRPDDYKAHQELGLCLMRLGRHQEGIAELRRVTALAPDYAIGHCNLGLALEDAGDIQAAADSLRQALRLDRRSAKFAYHLAAINAQANRPFAAPPACPREYLLDLFNGYADRFDHHLFQSLRYRGPLLLHDIIAAQAPESLPAKPWDILDLGCGTGMTALPFRDDAHSIVGVDLSPRMLELAERRTTRDGKLVYDDTIESDLKPVLKSRPDSFDVILSADVFIYIGDLKSLFSAIHAALRPGGVFAFTIEVWNEGGDYRLLPTRRYAHNPVYIRNLADQTGFSEIAHHSGPLRLGENNQPIPGEIFLLRR